MHINIQDPECCIFTVPSPNHFEVLNPEKAIQNQRQSWEHETARQHGDSVDACVSRTPASIRAIRRHRRLSPPPPSPAPGLLSAPCSSLLSKCLGAVFELDTCPSSSFFYIKKVLAREVGLHQELYKSPHRRKPAAVGRQRSLSGSMPASQDALALQSHKPLGKLLRVFRRHVWGPRWLGSKEGTCHTIFHIRFQRVSTPSFPHLLFPNITTWFFPPTSCLDDAD